MTRDADPDAVAPRAPLTQRVRAGLRTPRARRAIVDTLLLGGAWLIVVWILMTRSAGLPVWRTLWAEDGSQFLSKAFLDDGPGGWLESYQGYLHLLPRMIAAGVVHAPVDQLPFWMALISSLVAAGCFVLLAVGLRPWLPETWMQAGLVVALGCVREASGEVAANVANLHWFVGLGLVGLVLLRPRTWWGSGVAAATALVFALTDAFVVFFLGAAGVLLVVRIVRRSPDVWRTTPVVAAMAVGALAQVATSVRHPRTPPAADQLPWDTVRQLYVEQVWGDAVTFASMTGLELAFQAVVVVLLVAIAVVVGWRSRREDRLGGRLAVAAVFALASVFFLVLSVRVNHAYGDRYSFLPAAFMVTAVVVAVAGRTRVHRVLVGSVVLAMAASAVQAGSVNYVQRTRGPDVVAGIDDARRACEAGRKKVAVVVSPGALRDGEWTGNFRVVLPCSQVLGD